MKVFTAPFPVRRALRGGPRSPIGVRGDAEQVSGDHAEAHGPGDAVGPAAATALQIVSAFEHTDASFAADAHRMPLRNQRWRSKALRAGDFGPIFGSTTVTDMVGGGPFQLEVGQWTDDTSMALCLATSLVECRGFDAKDQMDRYVRWSEDGYLSSNGTCFDIGGTVSGALARYRRTRRSLPGSTDKNQAGNGCIMRLAPVPMWFYPDIESMAHHAAESSRTTHGTAECLDACRRLSARVLCRAFEGQAKEDVLFADAAFSGAPKISAIARGDYRGKARDAVRGSGDVVDGLEAALWCVWTTHTFEAAILEAANLGDDSDTTAAVAGQVAGALYGIGGIPVRWRDGVSMHELIVDLADRLRQVR